MYCLNYKTYVGMAKIQGGYMREIEFEVSCLWFNLPLILGMFRKAKQWFMANIFVLASLNLTLII